VEYEFFDNKANAEIKVKINCIEDIAAESPIFTER
jgi:hypothetical protein